MDKYRIQFDKIKGLGAQKLMYVVITMAVLITNVAILLNIPFLRQIFGFLFLTFLPGLLILQILKLNKIGSTEKFVLSVGLSIAFLMFFGLLINNSLLSLGYDTPLSTVPLLISFNIAFIVLAAIGYMINKEPLFSPPNINLNTPEKAFLIVPVLFPALSLFGMHVMNTSDNNLILMFLLILIPIYVAFVCFFNHKFPKRLYPVVIFSISISLLLLLSLRSNHIIGADTHQEYCFFQTTLDNLHWSVFGHNTLDACLAISLLPTIYQRILNIPSEFLSKVLYSLIFSISPLAIYVLSKRYVGDFYGFLTSCFFMSQQNFLWTEFHARTNTAILFFTLAMMALFSDKIDPLKKRILFIVFMASCMVSHYSTTYIFFFVMLGSFLAIEALSKKYTVKKAVSFTIVVLFFALIFFWYSQVTEAAFTGGVCFIENTLSNLNRFFIEESRSGSTMAMLGGGIWQKGIPHKIEFVFTWLTFAFIGVGIITLIRRYKEMSFPELKFKKQEFLKEKFEVGYFVIALCCSGLFVAIVLIPYITVGYGLDRAYLFGMIILSVFFTVGGIIVTKYLNKLLVVLRDKVSTKNASHNPFRKSVDGKDASQVRAYLIILLVLVPYFLCVTGVTYQMFSVPRAIILNSEGEQYDVYYVHDQESYCAKWLGENYAEQQKIYTLGRGRFVLRSSGMISSVDYRGFFKHKKINGYLYLRYYNVVNGKLRSETNEVYNMTDYSDMFVGKSKIYNNGGSDVYI